MLLDMQAPPGGHRPLAGHRNISSVYSERNCITKHLGLLGYSTYRHRGGGRHGFNATVYPHKVGMMMRCDARLSIRRPNGRCCRSTAEGAISAICAMFLVVFRRCVLHEELSSCIGHPASQCQVHVSHQDGDDAGWCIRGTLSRSSSYRVNPLGERYRTHTTVAVVCVLGSGVPYQPQVMKHESVVQPSYPM